MKSIRMLREYFIVLRREAKGKPVFVIYRIDDK